MEPSPEPNRAFQRAIVEALRGKGRLLVVTHDHPDPDALASAYALCHLLLVTTGQEATIAFGGIVGRSENRAMIEEFGIRAVALEGVELDEFAAVCMVDTQPGAGNNSWPVERPVDLVVDHHPLRQESARCRFYDVRPEFGACATILFEYLRIHEVYVGTKLATMLFYAIKSETQDLGREWVKADRDAYLSLLPFSNNRMLARIARPRIPHRYFASFSRAIGAARLYGPALFFDLGELDTPEMVAEMAEFLLRAEGVETVLGTGRFGAVQILSLRLASEREPAGVLLRQVVRELGTAGGHGLIAGGQIPLPAGGGLKGKALVGELRRRFLAQLGIARGRGRRLVAPGAGAG